MGDDTVLNEKMARLVEGLQRLQSVLVAFSGGVDSSLLLSAASEALPGRVLAVTAEAAHHPARERRAAIALARRIGVPHLLISCGEERDAGFRDNGPLRCYHCKRRLLLALRDLAREKGLAHVVHGANRDDRREERPGMRAAMELGVPAPLLEAGLGKEEVRALARRRGLPNWDKPAMSCLATRIPQGTPITPQALARVEEAEGLLRDLGLRHFRVRIHDDWARIEVPPGEMPMLISEEVRLPLLAGLERAGWRVVTLDLAGYRPSGQTPDGPDGEPSP